MRAPKTLQEAIIYFANPDNCVAYMVDHRWPNGVVCPACGRRNVSYLATQKKWQCKSAHAKRQFSAKVGTIFEDSPLGLEKWLPAVWLIVTAKNGISSMEIHRSLGVTQKTAWFMLHRIREAMKNGSILKMGGNDMGPVEVDETFVGPKPQKMHRERRLRMQTAEKGNQKAIVMGMLDRDSRQVRAMVVPNVRKEVLQAEILNGIEGGSTVYTDGYPGYDQLLLKGYLHQVINHTQEFVRGQVHTQGIDNFWSLLKRMLTGTYVAVEPFHLDRYVTEQVFRYNNRATKDNPLTDADRVALLISQVAGRRLTYAEVTGKVGGTAF
ncbi:MAG: IS1595 family transposase [Terracidiphilus sp.]|jgi:transposase-like protein